MTEKTLSPKAACRSLLLELREWSVNASISRDEFAEDSRLVVRLELGEQGVSTECDSWRDAAAYLSGSLAVLKIGK